MCNYHTVSIKGSMAEAIVAANLHSMVLLNPTKHPRFNEGIAYVHGECLPELLQWFNEYCDFEAKEAQPGTLLWFSGAHAGFKDAWQASADADDKQALELAGMLESVHSADAALIRGVAVTGR